MLLQDKQIAIIGGGPGGLTLARLLQIKGVYVKVYERDFDSHARVQGAPLDLHDDSGLAAICAAGLLDVFKANFLPEADKLQIMNERAEVFHSDHDYKPKENFGHKHFRPEIDRGVLRKILLNSLAQDTVVWDSHFINMEKHNNGWLLLFKNGISAYADMVIAADGANSKIRQYVTDAKPFYSGITMLEGNIYQSVVNAPGIHALLKGGKIMAFGNKKNILMGQKGNGDLGFYASFKAPENWPATSGLNFNDREQITEWFKNYYNDWHPLWQELFDQAALPFVPRLIYCAPLEQTWEAKPNVTLIGDAAHVMPPFAGEGANMAMLDALELSQKLTEEKFDNLTDSIASFESSMRKRAAAAAQESLINGERMHANHALTDMLEVFKPH
ncbi:NAD(P)/FAD-dependent oxidoreductase [Mucilaginibacter defluvii]|uniref:Flavin-dependent monooxygenase n=1 Tax=Mucilaginibacter defluvii TaxID=1196019 RepID=A0ABP9FSF8_9SPHI